MEAVVAVLEGHVVPTRFFHPLSLNFYIQNVIVLYKNLVRTAQ
jgi:hypothetical protein